MPTFLTRFVGLVLLAITIGLSSCQAIFPSSSTINLPQQLNPGSFNNGR